MSHQFLSDAIRASIEAFPVQTHYGDDNPPEWGEQPDRAISRCAWVGAASVGFSAEAGRFARSTYEYGPLPCRGLGESCFCQGRFGGTVSAWVVNMNHAGLSREVIAKEVQKLERKRGLRPRPR